ncbi:MAG: PAS domain S-box protein [Candidatus Lokiarchaeota archaeon]|nr:PAS domain S-box protein [Candidatus Lokiarchaeota archaeon]
MKNIKEHLGIVFICDLHGTVSRVLHNSFNLKDLRGRRFSSLDFLNERDKIKFENFLTSILNKEATINWDMNFYLDQVKYNLQFTGFIMGENVLVIGTTASDTSNLKYIEELLKIHNEQINNYRSILKHINESEPLNQDYEGAVYEEITRLNNTLVNLQRELTKKNTELNKTTKELSFSNKKLEAFVETIPAGILVVEHDGNIILANRKMKYFFKDLLKVDLSDLRNLNQLNILNPLLNRIREIIKSKSETEISIESKPREQWLKIISKRVHSDFDEESTVFILEVQDITSFVKFDYLRQQFVSNVSHELKNPITAITLTIESMEKFKDKLSVREINDFWDIISKNARTLNEIVDDLLLLSKADMGSLALEIEPINLNSLIKDLLHQMSPKINEKRINVNVKIKENSEIIGDRKRLGQVFRILIDNALKYSDQNSTVKINKVIKNFGEFEFDHKKGVLIEVKDSGIGIRKTDISNLFQPFFRSPDAKGFKGTGLGLSIAKELVSLHNGHIFVKSEYGKGSSFYVYIPFLSNK